MGDDQGKRSERNKYVYELVNNWIENADNKVSVSCGIFSGVFVVISFLRENYIKIPKDAIISSCWNWIYKISFILSFILLIASIYYYVRAIIPNLGSNCNEPEKKKYPIYYGDIRKIDEQKYLELMMNEGTEDDFNAELIKEIYINSGICLKKMERYKTGVILSFAAIVAAVVSLGAHFLMYR